MKMISEIILALSAMAYFAGLAYLSVLVFFLVKEKMDKKNER